MTLLKRALNALTGLVTAVAAGIAAFVAMRGLSVWRDEMRGRRNAELAEEVLSGFYQARDVYAWVRNPGGFDGEAAARKRQDDESESLAGQLDSYFVPIARLHDDQAFLSAFYAKRYRFRAVFGKEADKPFQTLREIDAEIRAAANTLARVAHLEDRKGGRAIGRRESQGEPLKNASKSLDRAESCLWDWGPDDEVNKRIDKSVNKIEKLCWPAIKAILNN